MKMETMQNMIRHASSKYNVKDENATSSKPSTLCSNKYGTKSGKLQENAWVSKSTENWKMQGIVNLRGVILVLESLLQFMNMEELHYLIKLLLVSVIK